MKIVILIFLVIGICDAYLMFLNLYRIRKYKNGKHYCNKCMTSYLTAGEHVYAYCPHCSNELDFSLNNHENRKEVDVIKHEICKDMVRDSEQLVVDLNFTKAQMNRYKKVIDILKDKLNVKVTKHEKLKYALYITGKNNSYLITLFHFNDDELYELLCEVFEDE